MYKMVRKSFSLNENINEKLIKESERIGISQSNLISFALDFYFRSINKNNDDPKVKAKE